MNEAIAIQYAALISDLMAKTKQTLSKIQDPKITPEVNYSGPVTLRMRTKEDTELIVTDFCMAQVEYILVTIQNCNYIKEMLNEDGEDGDK